MSEIEGMEHPEISLEGCRLLLAGCGATGSWTAEVLRELHPGVELLCLDRDVIESENLAVAALEGVDPATVLGRHKAEVVAERFRTGGGRAYAVRGDVRYQLTPGMVETIDAALLCFDNAPAYRDASEVLWSCARAGVPVLAVTCGGDEDDCWLVRVFGSGGACPTCLADPTELRDAAVPLGGSCTAADAPRASARAAAAAARAAVALLARVLGGERTLIGSRHQRDGHATSAWMARMPAEPVAGCPVEHARNQRGRIERLHATIDDCTVGALAGHARALAGDDATFVLGRRAVPLAGFQCAGCQGPVEAPLRLLPAAAAAATRTCGCTEALHPLGARHLLPAAELLDDPACDLTLREFGAAEGDGFLAVGAGGSVDLRCALGWDGTGAGEEVARG